MILGLTAAAAYGAADFLTQQAGRAVGPWRATFYYYLLGFAALSALLLLRKVDLERAWHASMRAWLLGIGSGLALLLAVLLFTTGMTRGKIAVVAPVTAAYGAVTTLLTVAVGQRFTLFGTFGLFLTIGGACVAAVPPSQDEAAQCPSGVLWALAAAGAYGVGFWVQGQFVVPTLGAVLPVWIVYATGLTVFGGLQSCRAIDLKLKRVSLLLFPVLTSGALSVCGFLALDFGLKSGKVALVIVLSSLTSAITVLLSRIVNGTRLAMHQWMAVAAICAGLALLRA